MVVFSRTELTFDQLALVAIEDNYLTLVTAKFKNFAELTLVFDQSNVYLCLIRSKNLRNSDLPRFIILRARDVWRNDA